MNNPTLTKPSISHSKNRVPLHLQDLVDMGMIVELSSALPPEEISLDNSIVEDETILLRSNVRKENDFSEKVINSLSFENGYTEMPGGVIVEDASQYYSVFPRRIHPSLLFTSYYPLILVIFCYLVINTIYLIYTKRSYIKSSKSFRLSWTEMDWSKLTIDDMMLKLVNITIFRGDSNPSCKQKQKRAKKRRKKKRIKVESSNTEESTENGGKLVTTINDARPWDDVIPNRSTSKCGGYMYGNKQTVKIEQSDDEYIRVHQDGKGGSVAYKIVCENGTRDIDSPRNDVTEIDRSPLSNTTSCYNKYQESYVTKDKNDIHVESCIDGSKMKSACISKVGSEINMNFPLTSYSTPQKSTQSISLQSYHQNQCDSPFLSPPFTDRSHRDLQRQLTSQYIEDHGLESAKAAELAINTVNDLRMKAWELQHHREIEAVKFHATESVKSKRHQEKLQNIKSLSNIKCPLQSAFEEISIEAWSMMLGTRLTHVIEFGLAVRAVVRFQKINQQYDSVWNFFDECGDTLSVSNNSSISNIFSYAMSYFPLGSFAISSSTCFSKASGHILTLSLLLLIHKVMRYAYFPQIAHNILNAACIVWCFDLTSEIVLQPVINIVTNATVAFCMSAYSWRIQEEEVDKKNIAQNVKKLSMMKLSAVSACYIIVSLSSLILER